MALGMSGKAGSQSASGSTCKRHLLFSSSCKYTCLGQELGLGAGGQVRVCREGEAVGWGLSLQGPPFVEFFVRKQGVLREAGLISQSRAQPSGLFEVFPKTQLGSKSAQTES